MDGALGVEEEEPPPELLPLELPPSPPPDRAAAEPPPPPDSPPPPPRGSAVPTGVPPRPCANDAAGEANPNIAARAMIANSCRFMTALLWTFHRPQCKNPATGLPRCVRAFPCTTTTLLLAERPCCPIPRPAARRREDTAQQRP